jgi:uncharacterized protein
MILDTRRIPEGHSESFQETDLAPFKEFLPTIQGKIRCKAVIDRSGPTIFVQVEFSGKLRFECSRCLSEFDYPMLGNLRLVLKEQAGKSGPATDDDALDFYFDPRHVEVDLGPAIYEEIMITIPLKPLCSENCKGIEITSVGKETREPDPRWEKLRNLGKN